MQADRGPGLDAGVGGRAAPAAAAALDPHDAAGDALAVGALEAQANSAVLSGPAAAAVHTGAASARPIAPGRGAAGERDVHRFPRTHGAPTLLPFLE